MVHRIGVLTRIAKDGTRARAIISWPLRAIQVKARYPGQGEHASRYHANPSPMQYPCQLDLGCAVPPLKRKHFYPGLRPKLMTTASPSGPRSLKAAPTHQPQPLNGPPEPPEARQYRPDPVS